MENMIVLNTLTELKNFLYHNTLPTLVNRVAFASDLLEHVRCNDNQICLDEELGLMDDGGWIGVDEVGYVVEDMYLP